MIKAIRCSTCGAKNEKHEQDHLCRMHRLTPDAPCDICGSVVDTAVDKAEQRIAELKESNRLLQTAVQSFNRVTCDSHQSKLREQTESRCIDLEKQLADCHFTLNEYRDQFKADEGIKAYWHKRVEQAEQQVKNLQSILSTVFAILEPLPELNMSNYTVDDVATLNAGMVEAFMVLDDAVKTHEVIKELSA